MDVFLEFENTPRSFTNPVDLIVCRGLEEIPAAFARIEKALADGLAVAGFLSYEAGYGFEDRLKDLCPDTSGFPLLMMGCYASAGRDSLLKSRPDRDGLIENLDNNIPRESYDTAIREIRDHISRGDVYQITYCLKKKFSWSGSAEGLYRALFRHQPVPYPAFIRSGEFRILSLSPEMYLRKKGRRMVTKPMKGTWPRGTNPLDDGMQKNIFRHDEKNRAENVMITDLMRNDLGRIGGEVRVPRLFEVRSYRYCFQMTSTVTARVDENIPVMEIFRSLFPSGSVTGAPKIRAMEIIRRLEPEPRHIYTGAIGCITPGRDMFFNIPIRTLLLRDQHGEMGVGGGIVWDSTADGEWLEGEWKSEFLRRFSLGVSTALTGR